MIPEASKQISFTWHVQVSRADQRVFNQSEDMSTNSLVIIWFTQFIQLDNLRL